MGYQTDPRGSTVLLIVATTLLGLALILSGCGGVPSGAPKSLCTSPS